jgi:hypothetical protein
MFGIKNNHLKIALILLTVYFIYNRFFNQSPITENFSDAYVRGECSLTGNTLNKIDNYTNKHCDPNRAKTINEELDCRYYDDKHIYMHVNKNSWCEAPNKQFRTNRTPHELQEYLKQNDEKEIRNNDYFETEIVNSNKVTPLADDRCTSELNKEHFRGYGTQRKNPYKWELPYANNHGDPEPIDLQYPYRITEADERHVAEIPLNVTGFEETKHAPVNKKIPYGETSARDNDIGELSKFKTPEEGAEARAHIQHSDWR